jgi:predicted RNA-binding protein with PIN domain
MVDHYFIDAYNVILKSSHLRRQARMDLESARDALLELALSFSLTGHNEITVVFDGRNEQHHQPIPGRLGNSSSLHIHFSPTGRTADTVIERLIYQQENRMRCIVVSNDRSLRDQCRGMGAMTMEADSFLTSIAQMQQRVKEQLDGRRRPTVSLVEERLSGRSLESLAGLREKIVRKEAKKK